MPSSIYDEYFEDNTSSIESSLASANSKILSVEEATRKGVAEILARVRSIEANINKSTTPSNSSEINDIRSMIKKIYSATDEDAPDPDKVNGLVSDLSDKLSKSNYTKDSTSLSRSKLRRSSIQSPELTTRESLLGKSARSASVGHPVFGMIADIIPNSRAAANSNVSNPLQSPAIEDAYNRESAKDIVQLDKNEQKRHDDLIRYLRRALGDKAPSTDSSGSLLSGLMGSASAAAGAVGGAAVGALAAAASAALAAISSPAGLAVIAAVVVAALAAYLLKDKLQGGPQTNTDNLGPDAKNYGSVYTKTPNKLTQLSASNEEFVNKHSDNYGISPDLVKRVVKAEGNSSAKSSTTSAIGLGQVTDAAWADVMKTNKGDFIAKGLDPNNRAGDQESLLATTIYLSKVKSRLTKLLGREPTDEDISSGYMLGADAYARLAQSDQSKDISEVLSSQTLKNNPALLKRGKKVKDVRGQLSSMRGFESSEGGHLVQIRKNKTEVEYDSQVNDQKITTPGADAPTSQPQSKMPPITPPSMNKTSSAAPTSSPAMSVASNDSMGRGVSGSPLFVNDAGMLLFLSGCA